jgi:DNA mismatch repair protein MutS
VLVRARQVLTVLEQRSTGTASSSQKASVLDDLPLFAHRPQARSVGPDPVHFALDAVRPDEMTPKQAIEALYELKKIRDDARRS